MTNQNDCGCAGANASAQAAEQPQVTLVDPMVNCPVTVSDQVCLQADLEIVPSVTTQTISVKCVGGPVLGPCASPPMTAPTPCRFSVSQVICAEFKLNFSAEAAVRNTSATCEMPALTPCPPTPPPPPPPPPGSCTHTIGFWRNQGVDLTTSFLPILLGNGGGLSINVTTTAQAVAILQPSSGPSSVPQYNQLYAQLLAANLNVLNGATCAAATAAIAAANEFLSASDTPDQKTVAAALASTLEQYNSGQLDECPGHCED
ncbi:hypothetical protein EV586_103694 [Tumebacillus sp. BK434]|uniref:hypothetical protein n=1 Tax=Tumebacillus sp. BK434 TaxID=2512169 RepID=UPI001048EE6F|nr:hypothetical protein [Tumebacillus sp. BK434]TCP56034.1 hypothetical protein EV586_103694 [Tumebacillus sp. BK434]